MELKHEVTKMTKKSRDGTHSNHNMIKIMLVEGVNRNKDKIVPTCRQQQHDQHRAGRGQEQLQHNQNGADEWSRQVDG